MESCLNDWCGVYCFWIADVEQWKEPVIFAQASLSRLSEINKSSPRSFFSNTRPGERIMF